MLTADNDNFCCKLKRWQIKTSVDFTVYVKQEEVWKECLDFFPFLKKTWQSWGKIASTTQCTSFGYEQ